MTEEVNGVVITNEVIIAPIPAGTNQIGTVGLVAGSAAIGTVALTAGNAAIGTVGVTGSVAVTGTFYQTTQPVSGTVTVGAGSAAIGSVSVSNFPTTQPVSGTVTANLGTLNGAATAASQTAVQGSATGGTAAGSSQLDGGIYNSTALALTNGQQSALQLDSSGYLKVNVAVGGSGSGASTVANGADVAEGSTTDAPLAVAASTAASTVVSIDKGLFNLLFNGTARIRSAVWWTELTAASVAASGSGATVQGTIRTDGSTSGGGTSFGYFQATAWPTQAGTLYVYNQAGTNLATTVNVAAGGNGTIKVPNLGGSFQAVWQNTSGNAGTVTLLDAFTQS